MNSLDSFAKFIPANSATATSSAAPPLTVSPATTELDFKIKRFTNGLNDSLYELSNEPSLGLYRIQEHVRKNMPAMLQKSGEMQRFQSDVKGRVFDLEYSIEAVNKINKADAHLDSIKQMLTDSMYAARQIKLKTKSTSPTGSANASLVTTSSPRQPDTPTSRVKDIKSSVSNFSITNVLSTKSIRTSSISIYENLNNKLTSKSNGAQSSQKDDQNNN